MVMDKLYEAASKISPVCAGLDTQLSFLPSCLLEKDMSAGEKIFEFNRRVIDATYENVACYKVQIACYEALGLDGMLAFSKTVKYARAKGVIVISDVKRGDISSTAKQYATGHFTGDFETDIMTVNSYMGEDAVSPYYDYLDNKALFLLIKTSNPSSKDIQDIIAGDKEVYMHMAEKVSAWGERFVGESGFSALGAVVGLTYPKEFLKIKAAMPHTFFLIPGYGAQGGTGKDIAEVFSDRICGVVNSSRGLLTAHKGVTEGADFDVCVNNAVLKMKEDITKWL